jgi:16S rRNA U516 pseudouridylate synthase RsuA-like enzyme
MAEERLQKLIAAAGVASRRKAEELIVAGEVTVNGRLVKELGAKADPERDHVKVRGRLINPRLKHQEKIYILLNKPLGVLTSRSDPKNRPLVIDLVGPYRDKVHPVGRLDFNTEGLLLLTNDGDFTNLITGAKQAPKVYEGKAQRVSNSDARTRRDCGRQTNRASGDKTVGRERHERMVQGHTLRGPKSTDQEDVRSHRTFRDQAPPRGDRFFEERKIEARPVSDVE